MPTNSLSLPQDHAVRFTHPLVSKGNPLIIKTGANQIQWGFGLNTSTTPTFGGQVIQVLSCYVDAITIVGSTISNNQLKNIYEWFRAYGQVAGLNKRDEHGVLFQYPERGWQLYIQPTAMPNFGYAMDQIARTYTIQAEVVADPAGSLQKATMTQFTERLFNPSMLNVGFKERNPFSDPDGSPSALPNAKNYADNFQALLGSYASGDFAHWAFDALDPVAANHLDPNTKDFWTQYLGSDYVSGTPPTGTGSASLAQPSTPTTRDQIVNAIATGFSASGIPPELGVAVAYIESSLLPDRWQGSSISDPSHVSPPPTVGSTGAGLFQTTNVGGSEEQLYRLAVQHYPDPITKWFPALKQIQFAAERFLPHQNSDLATWGYNAQRPADPAGYIAKLNATFPEARQWIQQAAQAVRSLSGIRGSVVNWANQGYSKRPFDYSHANRPPSQWAKGHWPSSMDCSLFVSLCYLWGGAKDPQGSNFSGSDSFSMEDYCKSKGFGVALKDTQPGDILIYNDHVEVFATATGDKDSLVIGMGFQGGPGKYTLASSELGHSDAPRFYSPINS